MTPTCSTTKPQNYVYCGSTHESPGACPMVKALEYYPDGTLKRVEFKSAADYPQQVYSGVRTQIGPTS